MKTEVSFLARDDIYHILLYLYTCMNGARIHNHVSLLILLLEGSCHVFRNEIYKMYKSFDSFVRLLLFFFIFSLLSALARCLLDTPQQPFISRAMSIWSISNVCNYLIYIVNF